MQNNYIMKDKAFDNLDELADFLGKQMEKLQKLINPKTKEDGNEVH